jgi:hypothetical protein
MDMKDNIHYQWLTSEVISDLDEYHNDLIHSGDDFNVNSYYSADEENNGSGYGIEVLRGYNLVDHFFVHLVL